MASAETLITDVEATATARRAKVGWPAVTIAAIAAGVTGLGSRP
ncbi:hypothetical protein [Streptomyces tropicalis]|uniref:Uncharacterized protein n=1 Tax=Streptomyces tropicalis TaxID=3034234 RepID=A0ABT6A6X6_9ACTN|nr:hypothetical protein [Streptomyces tropicalis]MDF3300126.1 hypothetical protein [Streptomyces tropicalis]